MHLVITQAVLNKYRNVYQDRLNLKESDQFIVVGEGDVVILKAIAPPRMQSFDVLIEQARQQSAESGLESSDIANATKNARERMGKIVP